MIGGGDLYEFALERGYKLVQDESGQAILSLPEDEIELINPISVPYKQEISKILLRYILAKIGATEDEFQRFVNRKNKRGSSGTI